MSKFIVSVTYTIMLFVPYINKAVISAPMIGMDNTVRIDFPADYCLQGLPGTIRNDLGIDFATALEDTKDGCFARCSPTTFSFYASGAKV